MPFTVAAILDVRMKQIVAILNFPVSPMPPAKFQLDRTWAQMSFMKIFKMATMVAILDIGTKRI